MNEKELGDLLSRLISQWENEVTEFKNVGDSYSASDIGKYFSALSNEANLRKKERAWLVFGVDNKSRRIVGSDFRRDRAQLDRFKLNVSCDTEPSVTFREIYELNTALGRVVIFEVPAAPWGMPISWKGHYYGRAGESLTHLGLDKLDLLRRQTTDTDWSAGIVYEATLAHLDAEAVKVARVKFAQKHSNRFSADEIAKWSDEVFLNRCKMTIDGKLTRASILLLGRDEASHLLSPHPAELTWKLEGEERAYEHFHTPFLLNTTQLFLKIRNIKVRILPENSLLAVELAKYDQKIVLEALHNCIAHQDYRQNSRIIVTEYIDRLVLKSVGSFFEGSPIDYIGGGKTPARYRNPFLAQAMTAMNMIDTMGYGIHQMHFGQARRFFPLPDYDLSESNAVSITLHGKVVDPAYSRLLIQRTNLPISDIIALDRVQKNLPIDDIAMKRLRRNNFIEGRKPNLHVSASIAAVTATKAEYIRTRAQDDEFYIKLITDYLAKFHSATRKEIEKLLLKKLSDALDTTQKERKISSLLSSMRRRGKIINTASRKAPVWKIAE